MGKSKRAMKGRRRRASRKIMNGGMWEPWDRDQDTGKGQAATERKAAGPALHQNYQDYGRGRVSDAEREAAEREAAEREAAELEAADPALHQNYQDYGRGQAAELEAAASEADRDADRQDTYTFKNIFTTNRNSPLKLFNVIHDKIPNSPLAGKFNKGVFKGNSDPGSDTGLQTKKGGSRTRRRGMYKRSRRSKTFKDLCSNIGNVVLPYGLLGIKKCSSRKKRSGRSRKYRHKR